MSAETQSTSDAVDCDPASTISSSFAACANDAKISTLSITSGEGAAIYVKVEYKIDSGSYTTLSANLTVASFATDTSLTVSVCLLYTSPSPRDRSLSRMPSSA